MAQQNKTNQYLVDYSKELKKINDIDVKILNADIKSIISDPKQYALDFLEATIVQHVPSYRKAHKLGKELDNRNLNGKS